MVLYYGPWCCICASQVDSTQIAGRKCKWKCTKATQASDTFLEILGKGNAVDVQTRISSQTEAHHKCS